MPDFNVRSDSVNVEQIMEQIRARIREKRGVDYTEQQIRELATVKLEKLIDPRGIRSDLLQAFQAREPLPFEPVKLPLYGFEGSTIYDTHRGLLRFMRRLLNPLLKLLFNPNAIVHALHAQTQINHLIAERENVIEQHRLERRQIDALYYEVIHNLVVELTRVGVEAKNLKMRVESLASRLEFNERRARALESVVVYKPSGEAQGGGRPQPQAPQQPRHQPSQPPQALAQAAGQGEGLEAPREDAGGEGSQTPQGEGPGQRSRRRRRRRGRRGGAPAAQVMGGAPPQGQGASDRDAARDATGGHAPAAESMEQALASESQPHEQGGDDEGGPGGPGSNEP